MNKKIFELYEKWDNYYDIFNNYFWSAYRNKIYEKIINHTNIKFKKNLKILDLGGGASISFPQFILENRKTIKYTIIDQTINKKNLIQSKFLKIYQTNINDYEVYEKEIKEADLIILFGLLMYLNKKEQKLILKKIRSLSKDQTIVVIHDPTIKAIKYISTPYKSIGTSHSLFKNSKNINVIYSKKINTPFLIKILKFLSIFFHKNLLKIIGKLIVNIDLFSQKGVDLIEIYVINQNS